MDTDNLLKGGNMLSGIFRKYSDPFSFSHFMNLILKSLKFFFPVSIYTCYPVLTKLKLDLKLFG